MSDTASNPLPSTPPVVETKVKPNNSSSSQEPLESWQLGLVIGSLSLGVFLFGLDTTILATAIPQITTDFQSLPDVSWYGSAYLLTVTAFQPLFGSLYKYFNAKLVYLVSLVVFEGERAGPIPRKLTCSRN